MKYKYKGVTKTREEVTGVIEAQDEFEARLRLRNQQVRATSLVPKGDDKPEGSSLSKIDLKGLLMSKPIKLKGLVVFTRQFSSLIDSGVPVVQCLDILQQQEKAGAFKVILQKIKGDIES